eukprot:TRINITY_DN19682_c1_g3_i2.p2 TRINITY_DN19682_c1_g3~~TRINITY_DN19682_c1_g3_i2.p2  ORF type:complete len:228 (-),score=29.07 TRINITY_DN19682_c1_g3_i2:419-1102(-)
MLEYLKNLQNNRIVLASKSKQRNELLRTLGLQIESYAPQFEENLSKSRFNGGAAYAQATSRIKAVEAADKLLGEVEGRKLVDLVIAADTVVECGQEILEKPDSEEEAFRVIQKLSGNTHFVHTGVTFVIPKSDVRQDHFIREFSETSSVTFSKLRPETIQAYIQSGEPFGKAGSYAIQGLAGVFVERIEGCYYNITGLPINKVAREIDRLIQEGQLRIKDIDQNGFT